MAYVDVALLEKIAENMKNVVVTLQTI